MNGKNLFVWGSNKYKVKILLIQINLLQERKEMNRENLFFKKRKRVKAVNYNSKQNNQNVLWKKMSMQIKVVLHLKKKSWE